MKIKSTDIKKRCTFCQRNKTLEEYEIFLNGITILLPVCEECKELPKYRLLSLLHPIYSIISNIAKCAGDIEKYDNEVTRLCGERMIARAKEIAESDDRGDKQ